MTEKPKAKIITTKREEETRASENVPNGAEIENRKGSYYYDDAYGYKDYLESDDEDAPDELDEEE